MKEEEEISVTSNPEELKGSLQNEKWKEALPTHIKRNDLLHTKREMY